MENSETKYDKEIIANIRNTILQYGYTLVALDKTTGEVQGSVGFRYKGNYNLAGDIILHYDGGRARRIHLSHQMIIDDFKRALEMNTCLIERR